MATLDAAAEQKEVLRTPARVSETSRDVVAERFGLSATTQMEIEQAYRSDRPQYDLSGFVGDDIFEYAMAHCFMDRDGERWDAPIPDDVSCAMDGAYATKERKRRAVGKRHCEFEVAVGRILPKA